MASRQAAFDDEELAISLSPQHGRRHEQTAASPPNTSGSPNGNPNRAGDDMGSNMEQPLNAGNLAANVPHREKEQLRQRVGQYNIVKTLGEGSFGKVKLAVHRSTGQQVALKIIARKKLISRDMQGRVEREIEYLQLLRHPHIIKL